MSDYRLTEVAYNPFSKGIIERVFLPTEAQKEILLSCYLGGDEANLSYNESISLDLRGTLDVQALETSIQSLVKKFDSLRMIFTHDGSHGLVLKEPIIDFQEIDYSLLDELEKQLAVQEMVTTEASILFNLADGPLIRFRLLKLSGDWYQLVIVAHHVVCDGWSYGLILEDLAKSYNNPELAHSNFVNKAIQFADYANFLRSDDGISISKQAENYWLQKFQDSPPKLNLPTIRERPKFRTFKGKRLDFELNEGVVDLIKRLSAASKSSLVHTLKSLFEILIHKISNQHDFVIGFPAAGQNLTGFENVVGHCVNLLPTRVIIQDNITVLDFIKQRKNEVLDDLEFQNLTFGTLVQQLKIERERGRIPLVPVVFNVDLGMDDLVSFDGLESFVLSNPRLYENFEIFFNVTQRDQALVLEWSYNTQLFDEELITYWMHTLEWIIQMVSASPEMYVEKVLCQSKDFSNSLLRINTTEFLLQGKSSFLEHFLRQVSNDPKATAVIARDEIFSYRKLDELSRTISQNLNALNLPKGAIVAIYLTRNIELIASLLGILRSGLTYLPIDPSMPKERIDYILADAQVALVVTHDDLKYNIEEDFQVKLIDELLESSRNPDHFEEQVPAFDDLAYLLYTSGSTGKPKGTKISHGNLLNFLESMQQRPGISKGQRLLAITSISFDISGLELLLPLIAGATVVLATSEEHKDGKAIARLIQKCDVDMMQGTPSTFKMLKALDWSPPQRLKILCGGEPLFSDLARFLLKNSSSLWNMYGPTETTIWSTVKEVKNPESITVGQPIGNTQIYILSSRGNMVPLGSTGEICIGGLGVGKGYLNREDLTQQRFLLHPVNPSLGMIYKTGDIGRINLKGELECFGRMDDQVKIRGFRIELGEIESVLTSLPAINNAAVLAFDENQEKFLAAFITRSNKSMVLDEQALVQEIRSALLQKLPDYMVPTAWSVLEEFPLTTSRKIDKTKLAQLKIEKLSKVVSALPETASEKSIAAIWRKFLKVEELGMDDDFFELGGHSLLAVEIMVEIERTLGKTFPVNTIFQSPVFRDFCAKVIEQEESDVSWDVIVPIKPTGNKPPLFLIHGAGANVTPFYGLSAQMDEDQPVYGIQSKGLNGIDEPLQTIEEMAAFYLQEIKKVCPTGIFHIGGQSFGAYVTFEMAKQMKAHGAEMGKVILFDVPAYQSETALDTWGKIKMKVENEFEKRVVDLQLAVKNPESFKRMKVNSFTRKGTFLKKWLGLEKADEGTDLFTTIEKIRSINHKASDSYLLSYFEGCIYLIKAKIKTFLVSDKLNYGWQKFAKEVVPIDVDGDHNSMIDDPELVMNFAEKLQQILDEKLSLDNNSQESA
ncbi:non-ribosomal peptide synthetase [Mongoliitalea daihaiensis]|uniref:non-ribosomal peptide synthetase n=1 Tax=Mongoliitalea daihaiensis TaxID=2782006 RepID=UPI001F259AA9|nr:amino acid adenylation domain-containing protein [Mongoliitalea daihaiensis]UJP66882.1 amino acid adenylation domain-containing protein [Mongoliitalea daihaiensis]